MEVEIKLKIWSLFNYFLAICLVYSLSLNLKMFFFLLVFFYLNPKTVLHLPCVPSLYEWHGICTSVACLYSSCAFHWTEPFSNTSALFRWPVLLICFLFYLDCVTSIVLMRSSLVSPVNGSSFTNRLLRPTHWADIAAAALREKIKSFTVRDILNLQNNDKAWRSQVAPLLKHPPPPPPREK